MLFRTQGPSVIAISQPMHAWVAGQLLKAWNEALAEPVLVCTDNLNTKVAVMKSAQDGA
jgi:hypothetical protein